METTGKAFDAGEAPPTAVVEFLTFDQLEDNVKDEKAFLNETKTLSQAPPEFWTEQFQCIDNLRVLNKFHIGFFEQHVNEFNDFLVVQSANERSNNAKNALTYLSELFTNGNINPQKFEGNWDELIEKVLPTVLSKTTFHK